MYPKYLWLLFNCSVVSDSTIPQAKARQVSLSFTIAWSLLKIKPITLVIPTSHLILCHPLLLLPSIFPGIRVFSNESTLRINNCMGGSQMLLVGARRVYVGTDRTGLRRVKGRGFVVLMHVRSCCSLEEDMATHSSMLSWRISKDRGAWWAAVHGDAKHRTWLSD